MENAVRPVWIDPSWLSWEFRARQEDTGYGPSDTSASDTTARLYEIHQHACDRLAADADEFDRVDAIITLRRVVAQRVKALKEKYQLRDLPIGAKPRGDLELLSYFGIIRPFMLKRLIDIRNIVEHEASSPPPTDECLMFTDLVWYFLRSTDKLINERIEVIEFGRFVQGPDIGMINLHHYFSVLVTFRQPYSERPEISAFLDSASVAYESRATWMKVDATRISGQKEERINPSQTQAQTNVFGQLSCTDEQMKLIYDLYFRVSY